MRIDVDLVAGGVAALGQALRRPAASLSMELRRMLDVFVGTVRTWSGSRVSSDFYFDFARMVSGDPIDRLVTRIGTLAESDPTCFVDGLRDRGIRIAVDMPAFSSAWTARDPHLLRMNRGPRYAIWFDCFQIRIRDEMLDGIANCAISPPRARSMPDLLTSETSMKAFLAVVNEALEP
jgi:hypothetical protein